MSTKGKLILEIEEDIWPAQLAFYEEKNHFIVGYIGGWGSGKSHIGARKAIELACENKMTPGLVCGPSLGQVMDTTYPTIVSYLDQLGMPFWERRGQRPSIVLPWGNPDKKGPGWIFFRSLDRPDAIKGLNVSWAWVDEAGAIDKGEEAWQILVSRVRHPKAQRRQIILTGTGEAAWLKERFTGQDDRYIFFRASTRENLALPKEYMEQLARELPTNLQEVYIEGGFMPPAAGLVYSSFARDRNIDHIIRYEPSRALVHSLDFNVNPNCSVVAQSDGNKTFILSEIIRANSNTEEVAQGFVDKFGGHAGEVWVYGDPSGGARSTKSMLSDYDILRSTYESAFGAQKVYFNYRMADPGQRTRVNATNRMLRDPRGEARILIHPRCVHLIHDLEHLPWDEKGRIDKTQRNRKFGWTLSHVSDALAYYIEREFPILKPVVVNV